MNGSKNIRIDNTSLLAPSCVQNQNEIAVFITKGKNPPYSSIGDILLFLYIIKEKKIILSVPLW